MLVRDTVNERLVNKSARSTINSRVFLKANLFPFSCYTLHFPSRSIETVRFQNYVVIGGLKYWYWNHKKKVKSTLFVNKELNKNCEISSELVLYALNDF